MLEVRVNTRLKIDLSA